MGSLTGFLLTSGVSIMGGITWAIYGRHSMQICCGLSCTSFLKARSLHLASAQCIIFSYSRIRFFIMILISFIKEGVGGIVSGHISCWFYILSYKPKQASHFFFKIMSQFPKSIIRRGILYCLYPLTQRQIYKILMIGCFVCPLYLQIRIGLGSFSKGTFKKSVSFVVYLVLIKAKAFTFESAKAEVKT